MDKEYKDKLLQAVRPAMPADTREELNVLHHVYGAIIQGNFEALGESVTDDVELSICGFRPMDGTWRGRKEVVDATRRNFALVDGQQPEIEGIVSQGESVAVLLRESGVLTSTGEAYSLRGVQWFTFVGGKIKRIDEILASRWIAGV